MRYSGILPLLCLLAITASAQSGPCTELAIRKAVASGNTANLTSDDFYIFSAAFDTPVIGKAELEKARAQIQAVRSNEKYGPTQIERVISAPSGEMAYEYGTRQLSFDEKPTGKHLEFTNAYLRVWKAVDGSCLTGAIMYGREHQH